MKKTQFKKIMRNKGFKVIIGYGVGYTLEKNKQKYFISDNDINFLNDISYLNIEDYKF